MSLSYTIHTSNLDLSTWRDRIVQLFRSEKWKILTGIEDGELLEIEEIPSFNFKDGWYVLEGSIRGLTMERIDSKHIEARFPIMASRQEFQFLGEILRITRSLGARIESENVEGCLIGKDLTEAAIDGQFEEWWGLGQGTLRSHTAEGSKVSLPTPLYGFKVTSEQANMEPQELQQYLTESTQRYCEAFRASMMQLAGPQGAFITSVYPSIPTIFSEDATYISGLFQSDDGVDFIPAAAFYHVMSEHCAVERLPEHTYVPEVKLKEHPEILSALLEYAVSIEHCKPTVAQDEQVMPDQSGSDGAEESDTIDEVSEGNYGKILDAPILIFLLIAAADGKIDKKEVTAFGKLMEESMTGNPEQLMDIALIACSQDTIEKMANLVQLDTVEELISLNAAIKEQLSPEVAKVYCLELMVLGHAIANSSGGGLLGKIGLKKKVGKEEEQALAALIQIFELKHEDFTGLQ